MSKRASPPRLNQELTEEQYQALNELIPWGLRRPLFSALIDDLIKLLRDPKDRNLIMSGIINRSITIKDFVNLDVGKTEKEHSRNERPRTHGGDKPKSPKSPESSTKK